MLSPIHDYLCKVGVRSFYRVNGNRVNLTQLLAFYDVTSYSCEHGLLIGYFDSGHVSIFAKFVMYSAFNRSGEMVYNGEYLNIEDRGKLLYSYIVTYNRGRANGQYKKHKRCYKENIKIKTYLKKTYITKKVIKIEIFCCIRLPDLYLFNRSYNKK
jgi:hypothetical protein